MSSIHGRRRCLSEPTERTIDPPVLSFQNLLNADYIAPANQHSSIETSISTAEVVLEDIQRQKALLSKVIERTRAQESALDASIRGHKAMLSQSALRRIPLEVLGQIFIRSVESSYIAFEYDTSPFPVVLAQVCQRWRKAALLQSDLWSRLCVASDMPWDDEPLSRLFTLCLARSRNRPLTILIMGASIKTTFHEEVAIPMNLLMKESRRIKRLELLLESDSPVWKTLHGDQNKTREFSSLKTLYITGWTPYWHPCFDVFSTSPLLTEIGLGDSTVEGHLVLPTEQILRLEINGASLRSRYRTLERMTNLRELDWNYSHDYSYGSSLQHLILPNILRFTVNMAPCYAVERELSVLRFPQLESVSGLSIKSFCAHPHFLTSQSLTALSLSFSAHQEETSFHEHVKELVTLLPKVAPRLRHLSLSYDPQLDSELECSSPPSLVQDALDAGFIALLESMTDQDRRCFSHLETLSLRDISLPALDQALLRMVQERDGELSEIDLVFFQDTPPDLLLDFRHRMGFVVKEIGLRVTIRTGVF